MSAKVTIVAQVSPAVKQRLVKMKETAGYSEKDWGEWLDILSRDVHIKDNGGEIIQRNTRNDLLELWCQNLAHNLPMIWEGKSISATVPKEADEAEKAGKDPNLPLGTGIVIGRGPSLYKKKHLELLAASDYRGTIVCTDGALIDALKAGIHPANFKNFFVMTVDGNREKIWKWYDHELVDKYGEYIKAILPSSSAYNVAERCKKAGVQVYWYHPMFDDYRQIESFTKIQGMMTKCENMPLGCPAMNAGANAGACSWIFAWAVQRCSPVALIGIDMGYLIDQPLETTYYYDALVGHTGGDMALVAAQFIKIYNPDWDQEALQDQVFKYYRESLLTLIGLSLPWVRTVNCTEGGALFGERVEHMKFSEFLEAYKQ